MITNLFMGPHGYLEVLLTGVTENLHGPGLVGSVSYYSTNRVQAQPHGAVRYISV